MTFMSGNGEKPKKHSEKQNEGIWFTFYIATWKNHTHHRQWGNVVALIVFAKWYLVAPQLLKPETVVHGSENYNKFQHWNKIFTHYDIIILE